MRKHIFFFFSIFLPLAATAATAGDAPEKQVKQGWSLSALPCASYSTDLGFQYGAFGDVYHYGNGNTYPDPLHKFSWEASHYTQGRSRFFLAYDSKYLVPKMRINLSATYVDDPLYSLYGYNGAATVYDDAHPEYYYMNRGMLRLLADFQGQIIPGLQWVGGVSFWNFKTGTVKEKIGYDPAATLYSAYRASGLIEDNEAAGGNRLEVKGGLVYDTRDIEAAPNKGIWAELYLNASPDLGDSYKYAKLSAHWRQYLRIPLGWIKAGDPVFAYHLAYQGTVAGEVPYYMQQNINFLVLRQMISEGLGSYNTLRGTYANRMIGDAYAWANAELRVKLVQFKLFRQFFYIAANPFFDCGAIVQPYRAERMAASAQTIASAKAAGYSDALRFVKDQSRMFIYTAGLGMKLAWNENFILSAEVAHNFKEGLGRPLWISLGTSYSF